MKCCDADETAESEWQWEYRGRPKVLKRAKKVFHVRGVARFWHWSDVAVVEPPVL